MRLLNRILMDLVLLLSLCALSVILPMEIGAPGWAFLITAPAAFGLYVYVNRRWPPYE